MIINTEIADKYQEFFDFFSQEHNLILTIEEMQEILSESQKLESKLSQHDVSGSLPTDEHLKFAEWCISNGVTTYYNENDGERYIDNDKEIFFDISQIYEKFKMQ